MIPRKALIWIVGGSLFVALVADLSLLHSLNAIAADAGTAKTAPITVDVVTVVPQDVRLWETFSGRLEAVDRVKVRPRVAGAIQRVDFREGALVKKGDPLFTIDPAPFQAAVLKAQGQVASAEAKVSLAKTEVDRGRLLSESRTISQSNLDQRQSTLAENEAGLRSAQAALESAQLDLGYTEVHAPVSGRIGKIEVTVGNLVDAGSASPKLTTIVSVDPIYASFNASEDMVTMALAELPATDDAIPAVQDIPVEVGTLADDGTPIKGKLQFINNEVDASSGTIAVRAVLDNPGGKLISGQFVRVRMGEPGTHSRILITERAIGTDQDKNFVYVVDAENKASYRQIQLGGNVDGMRIVENGLAAGDIVVTNGIQRVRPGVIVNPRKMDVSAAD